MKARALLEHLEELRKRFLVVTGFFLISFALGVMISPWIIKKISADLIITNVSLVSLSPLEFIYTQLKVGFVFALAISFPVLVYELIRFIRPALKKKELIALKYIMPGFLMFFVFGVLFAYFVFLKPALFFLAGLSTLARIENLWSIHYFISFILWICFSLGLVFELPLLLLLLKKLNLITRSFLRKYRPHIYVLAFVIAAIITPPDVITQIIIALPLVILFEISYWLMAIIK